MKRIKASFGPRRGADRADFGNRRTPAPADGVMPIARPHAPRSAAHAPSGAPSWLGAGLFRALLLGIIVVGGVAVVIWLRDLGAAFGVNWVGGR